MYPKKRWTDQLLDSVYRHYCVLLLYLNLLFDIQAHIFAQQYTSRKDSCYGVVIQRNHKRNLVLKDETLDSQKCIQEILEGEALLILREFIAAKQCTYSLCRANNYFIDSKIYTLFVMATFQPGSLSE